MAARKKPQTAPQLDASARAEPEDRKARPSTSRAAKPKTTQAVQQRIDRAVEKIQTDSEFESSTGVRINAGALKGLCLRGPHSRRAELLEHVERTFDRLGVDREGGEPFGAGKGSDNYPGIHDLLRWLGAIRSEDDGDLELLRRCRATLTK